MLAKLKMLLLRAKVLSPSLLPSLFSFSLPTSLLPSLPPSFLTVLPWTRYGEAKGLMERSQKGLCSLLGSHFLGRTRHTELGSVIRQREREARGQAPLLWFLRERTHEAGQTDLGLANLSNVSWLRDMGAVTDCLVPDPGAARAGVYRPQSVRADNGG